MRLSKLLTSWRDGVRRGRRVSRRPSAPPGVERLEQREVPTVATNQAFVATLYDGFLGRAPTLADLSFWTPQLNSGATFSQVASGILASPEYRGHEVTWLYQSLLGRAPDLGGLDFFVGSLINGASLDQVRAAILASDEFFARAGGSAQGFLDSLYQNILARNADPLAVGVFAATAAGGPAGRQQVALQVLGSPEAVSVELRYDYQTVLARPLDPSGASFWEPILLAGTPNETVLADIVASSEFIGRLENVVATGADSVGAANQFITTNGLFLVVDTRNNPGIPPTVSAFRSLAPINVAQAPAQGPVLLPIGFNPGAFPSNSSVNGGSAVSTGTNVATTTGTGMTSPLTTLPSTSPATTLPSTSPVINLPFTSPVINLPFTSPVVDLPLTSPLAP
jgi:hypothetical protein